MARDFRIYGQVPRFQLDRRPGRSRLKARCPKCGKERCFTLYVDTKTGQPVGNEFGRCDHERRCGYDNRPTGKDVGDRELWISNNDVLKAFQISPNNDVTNFIEMKDVLETINPNESNTLFRFLSALWDRNFVESVFRKYMVGTKDLWSWTGSSVFWQIDKNFVCRTGKIMDYEIKEENGIMVDVKRVKDNDYPHVMFFHALNSQDYSLRQCLFGEHLLPRQPDTTVCVVEGEKTAVICAMEMPQYIWLSCGGCQGLAQARCASLAGRRIMVFPDIDAIPLWRDKLPMLQGICHSVMLSPWAQREGYPTPDDQGWENCAPKFDIADHIIGCKSRATLGQVCKWLEDYKVSPSRANVNFI